MPSLRIITTPVEDFIYHTNKKEEVKQKKPQTKSFEEELKIAIEKELKNGRAEE